MYQFIITKQDKVLIKFIKLPSQEKSVNSTQVPTIAGVFGLDKDDIMYLTTRSHDRLIKIVTNAGVKGDVNEDFSTDFPHETRSVTTDSNGDIYVQVSDSKIYKVNKSTGTRSEYATLPNGETHSTGMAFDSKNNLYVSIYMNGDKIYKITGEGATPESWYTASDNNPDGTFEPGGIAIDREDNLFIANEPGKNMLWLLLKKFTELLLAMEQLLPLQTLMLYKGLYSFQEQRQPINMAISM